MQKHSNTYCADTIKNPLGKKATGTTPIIHIDWKIKLLPGSKINGTNTGS